MHFCDGISHAVDRYRIALVGARHIAGGSLKLRRDVRDLHLSTHIDRNMAFIVDRLLGRERYDRAVCLFLDQVKDE